MLGDDAFAHIAVARSSLVVSLSLVSRSVFLTIEISDVPASAEIKINEDSVVFATNKDDKRFELNLVLNGKVSKDKSSVAVRPRAVEILLIKEEEGSWNRLLKDKNAYKTQCKIDWDKFGDGLFVRVSQIS